MPEPHKDGVHVHVHFAIARFNKRSAIDAAWGRGFVSIKLLSDLPVGSTSWHEARRAAGYLSKYVTKASTHVPGLHRYEVTQGDKPHVTRLQGRSSADVLSQACALVGARPEVDWSSADKDGWQGPPAVWFAGAA